MVTAGIAARDDDDIEARSGRNGIVHEVGSRTEPEADGVAGN